MICEIKRFARGFVYAARGICAAILQERNVRFHLCAAAYALAAGWLAELDGTDLALLFLCIGGVLGTELINSALERAVDKPDAAHWASAGTAKDMAAGAVLCMAITAVAVAACVFLRPAVLVRLWRKLTAAPWLAAVALAALAPAFLFVLCFGTRKEGIGKDKNEEQHTPE